MVERQKIFPNTPAAVELIEDYREWLIPNSNNRNHRECVAFSVQSACSYHEIPLEWVLDLHKIPGNTIHEDYWEGLKKHLERLFFVGAVRFEKINDFKSLLEKTSTMGEDERLLLVLSPEEKRVHIVHVITVVPGISEENDAIMVSDSEKGIRVVGEKEFRKNFAPEALYNCIFFKEAD